VPELETTRQGCRLATSVGGVLTGRGADIIVIDDPLKPEEALSQAQRRAANEWFDHTLYSRLNDKLRQRIRRGVFRSIADLQAAISAYVAEHNISPKPFVWTKSAEAILAKLDRLPVPSV